MGRKFFRRSVLKNGTVLLTERAEQFQSLSLGVWVKGGSRHETARQAGMAHFLEHMMFKGTARRTQLDIAREVDLVGGDFNAFTTREYTCFHITVPHTEVNFALDLVTDIIRDSRFDPVELERERMVIGQEIAMVDENPEEYIHDVMFEKAFGGHPLGRQILGYEKTLKAFTREDVVEFFQSHYYSKNIVISIAGAVDHNHCVKQLNRLFAGFGGKRRAHASASLKPPQFRPGVHVIRQDTDQAHIVVACEAYPIDHPDRVAVFLLNSFLGGSMSSALFQSIRERRGLAYTVYSSPAPFTDTGLLGVYAATNPKTLGTCVGLIREEIDKLLAQPISDDDLNVAKNTVKSAIRLGSDSMENRMFTLAKAELFYDKQMSDAEVCELVDKVRAADLWRVAKDLFGRERWLLVALGEVSKPKLVKAFRRKAKEKA